jgi:hypothetical protein
MRHLGHFRHLHVVLDVRGAQHGAEVLTDRIRLPSNEVGSSKIVSGCGSGTERWFAIRAPEDHAAFSLGLACWMSHHPRWVVAERPLPAPPR